MSQLVITEGNPDGGKYKRRYGLDWPQQMSDVNIELACAKKWREPLFKSGNLHDPWVHLLRSCRALFPPGCPCPFVISKWTEEHAYDFTTRPFIITWGCASASKSNDYGCFYVLDWGVDPHQTYSVVATTSKNMLLDRTFESILRYHGYLKRLRIGWPGKLAKARLAIINDDDDESNPMQAEASTKAQIKGVAVEDGTENEARAKLQGAHLPYVRQLGDELSQMRPAFMKVRSNLRAGAIDYRFHGLCNPDDLADLAGQFSVPLKGWASVDTVNAREWETQYGWVRHHNGYHSPAVLEPGGAEKYSYLINAQQIQDIIKDAGGNEDDPIVWTMVKGHPAPQGRQSTPLTPQMYVAYRMGEPAVWRGTPERLAFVDPAFSSGGDDCVYCEALLGWASDAGGAQEARMTLAIEEPEVLRIEAGSDVLVTEQIVAQVRQRVLAQSIASHRVGVDDSGIQNMGDIFARALGNQVFRMRNNGKASDLPVSAFDPTPSHERYYDQITEALYALRIFAEYGQIRGICVAAAEDLYNRRARRRGQRQQAETKDDFRKRMKRSPDKGDCVLGLVQMARHVLGFYPGAQTLVGPRGVTDENLRAPGSGFSAALRQASESLSGSGYTSPEA